jgi:D-amino peptidase
MRVLISVDMEGVAGVVDPDDITAGSPEFELNRRYMTDEASAAVRGVLAVHADAEIIVCDAHAGFRNLLPDRLSTDCELIRGGPRRHGMLSGVDDDVDAVLLIGYHAAAGTDRAVLAHTVSGGTLAQVRCNGEPVGEIGLAIALAAHFRAAPVLLSGDDVACREAEQAAPGIGTVQVKRSLGNRAARSLHPARSCELIEAAASEAMATGHHVLARTIEAPIELEVDLLRTIMAERVLRLPGSERVGPTTVRFRAPDMSAAYELVDVVATAAATG